MSLLRLATTLAALAIAITPATAQLPIGGYRSPSPPPQSVVQGSFGGHHHFRGGGTLTLYDDSPEVVHDVVVVHDQPTEPPAPPSPPPPPRQPWVLGRTYASLPGSCMKMVEGGAAYFLCSGDWYRKVGSRQYKAVARPS